MRRAAWRGEGEGLRLGAAKQPGGASDAGFVFVFAGIVAAAATAAAIFTVIRAATSAMGAAAEAGLILFVFIDGRAVRGGAAPLGGACISPGMIGQPLKDGRTMLSLAYPGGEVVKLGRQGLKDWVVILGRNKSGSPTGLEVKHRSELGDLLEKSNL